MAERKWEVISDEKPRDFFPHGVEALLFAQCFDWLTNPCHPTKRGFSLSLLSHVLKALMSLIVENNFGLCE